MAVNKVVYSGDTLMDISDTTATESSVVKGKTFYKANGSKATGTAEYEPLIVKFNRTLATASWTGSGPYTQTVTITGITVNSKVDIQMDATSLGVLIDSGTSAIWMENNNGTITAKCIGDKPNADMTVQVTITEVTA